MTRLHLVRADQGQPYDPPGHHGVEAARLQHLDGPLAGGVRVNLSRYAPGAWVDPAPTSAETVYVLVSGELELTDQHGEVTVLQPFDSVHLPLGQTRALRNTSPRDATLLVVLGDTTPTRTAQEAP